jgi:L-histidine Nalpha-methyltransferase
MITVENRLPAGFRQASLQADALAGLSGEPKSLPPKWFYDARGSDLFEQITELPEYYLTRAERSILHDIAGTVARMTGASTLVELGSGSSEKTRLLLDALRDGGTLRRYVPVDVSESALVAAGNAVAADYPQIDVHAVVSDYDSSLGLDVADDNAGRGGEGPRLVAFLGSTIGNMPPADRAKFLARIRDGLRPGDALLLGTDLVKDPAVLVAAYNDAAGVTAAFNRNVLSVLNSELGADFDPDAFEHIAIWDPEEEWIEMRLRSAASQEVRIPAIGLTVTFAVGEEMRTEHCAKFRRSGVAAELAAAGLSMSSWWTDPGGRFGLSLSALA